MPITDHLAALAAAAARLPGFSRLDAEDLQPLPTTGLAHDHVRLGDGGWLARVPRQSQMRLDARRNLAYQAACFARASASGHAPRLGGVIEPSDALPMGALVVEAIAGRPARLPGDLPAIARALAAIHALPVPPRSARAPLVDPDDPLATTLAEVEGQARFLDRAQLAPAAGRAIAAELDAARAHAAAAGAAPPGRLISFDAHPGNFLVDGDGRAVLVDLEKARYGGPGFDLAHASLYTSTTWDVASSAELSADEVAGFYDAWLGAVPADLAAAWRPWLLAMRRLMWLWSVTWCGKWRVQSRDAPVADKRRAASAEDWSADNSDAGLIAHVAGRVDCYLAGETIERCRAEWRAGSPLADRLSGSRRLKTA